MPILCSNTVLLKIIAREKKDIISHHTFMFPFIFEDEPNVSDEWIGKEFKIENQRDYTLLHIKIH